MTDPDNTPRLYVLMRTDLASMNPGKAVAQGAHAANQCAHEVLLSEDDDLLELLGEWEGQTGHGFGTTITLGVSEAQMRAAVLVARALGLHARVIHDPTYPLIDGETLHLLPLDTCAFVFGRPADCRPVVSNLVLMA